MCLQCHSAAVRRLVAASLSLADVVLLMEAPATCTCCDSALQASAPATGCESVEHMQHDSLYDKLFYTLWYPAGWALSALKLP